MTAETQAVRNWYALSADQCVDHLTTHPATGLSPAEAARRLQQFGPNEIKRTERPSPWRLLFQQFQNVLIVILLIAAVLSGVMGHEVEAIAIGVIVLFAAVLGFVQEYRAERSMEALRQMAAPTATVLRDGARNSGPRPRPRPWRRHPAQGRRPRPRRCTPPRSHQPPR